MTTTIVRVIVAIIIGAILWWAIQLLLVAIHAPAIATTIVAVLGLCLVALFLAREFKVMLILFIPILSMSCANYSGSRNTGEYHATIVGTDHKGYNQTAEGLSFEGSNQSKVALSGIRTIGTVGSGMIMAGVMNTASDNSAAIDLGAQATTRSVAAGKEATKQLAIGEVTKQAAIKAAPKP